MGAGRRPATPRRASPPGGSPTAGGSPSTSPPATRWSIPGYGGAQGIFFVASDLLGDNLLFGSVSSYQGRRLGSILSNISATAVYLNQTRRVNWGLGAFRTKSRNFEGDRVVAYDETAYGGIGLLRYPLTRFTRVEGTIVLEHSDRVDFTLPVDEPRRVGWIASHYLSYVHDNSLWVASGPIDGGRFALTAGVSSDFTNSRFDSYLVTGDWRQYFRLGQRSTWALRAFGFYSGGDRPRRINIGGTLGLRGYPAVRLHRRLAGLHVQSGAALPAAHPPHPRHAVRRHRLPRDPGRAVHRRRQGHVLHHQRPCAARELRH